MRERITGKYLSPLGPMTLLGSDEGLAGLWFDGQRYFAPPAETAGAEPPVFGETRRWLDRYFAGEDPGKTPDLCPEGTAFRKRVWAILTEIPYGETVTYGEIAARLAGEVGIPKMSARAVGNAVGHNPISVLVPCHRVIGSGGKLTGYAGGIEKKIYLLALEGVTGLKR